MTAGQEIADGDGVMRLLEVYIDVPLWFLAYVLQ